MKKIIIVGGVAGGATAAARLRRLSEDYEIIMIEKGEYISFANCGLPYYIGGVIKDRNKLFVQTKEGMEKRFNLDIRNLSEVTKVDRESKEVVIKDLVNNKVYRESYDKLILSPGAKPIVPGISGLKEAKNVFTLRNVPDTDKIYDAVQKKTVKNVTVIGGGFIGVEVAENLIHRGLHVTLIDMSNQVMMPFDFEFAQFLHEELVNKGVDLILGDSVTSIENEGKLVVTKSEKEIVSDVIVMAIGVAAETQFLYDSGIKLSNRNSIIVNDYMQTNDEDIFAIGDAIEVKHFISKKEVVIPLAWPANRQGRIVADIISGKNVKYNGSLGTSVIKVFSLTAAQTGLNEKTVSELGIDYEAVHINRNNHAGYYPGAVPLVFKIIFRKKDGLVLGAQGVGVDGVEKRIDVVATAIKFGAKITELEDIELSYAPPFGSAKDPVNIMGYVGTNVFNKVYNNIHWYDVDEVIKKGAFFLDVRTPQEYELGHINGTTNIELDVLRDNLDKLPSKEQPIYVTCQVGHRGYLATRILAENGYNIIYNLSGGFKVYHKAKTCFTDLCNINIPKSSSKVVQQHIPDDVLVVDACGLQCPGPIMEVKRAVDQLENGQVLKISASDFGFLTDVKAWCNTTNNTLLNVETTDKTVEATIMKGQDEIVVNKTNGKATTLVCFSNDLDKVMATLIIANGAASMGHKVSIFFTFWGLNVLRKANKVKTKKSMMEKMFGKMMPRGTKKLTISQMQMMGMGTKMMKKIMKQKNVYTLETLLQQAIDYDIKLIACTMSMDVMGIKKEELIDEVSYGGVASYLSDSEQSNINLFI